MINSIRAKLTLWYVSVLALIIIAFAGLTYFLVHQILTRQDDETLSEMARDFKNTLDSESADGQRKFSIEDTIVEEIGESHFHDYVFLVTDAANSRQIASSSTDDQINADLLKESLISEKYWTVVMAGTDYRLHQRKIVFKGEEYNFLIAHSLEDQEEFLARLRSFFLLAVPVTIIFAGLGGYFLARKSLAPVVQMSRRAGEISAINLNERLPVKNEKDELGNLAQVFNDLLQRLEGSFEQQRRFMTDASHELRTPLAIVRGESEVALSKDNRPKAELRESLAIVNDESKRLTKIVEDLFTLARADAGQLAANFSLIYVDELLADSVRAVHVLAQDKKIYFELHAETEMPLYGDEQLLRRLFINLLDNAIKYNHENGKVSVTGEIDHNGYRVRIADSGMGIAKYESEKIFERFYRADKARTRADETLTSGAGLGLSIAARIAELHHGKIELVYSDAPGTIFAVSLPITAAAK